MIQMAENDIMNEIEAEIKKAKGEVEDFEIEVIDDPVEEAREEAVDVAEETEEPDYGPKVQKRIQKLVGSAVRLRSKRVRCRSKTNSSKNVWNA